MSPFYPRAASLLTVATLAAFSGYYLADERATNSLISEASSFLNNTASGKYAAILGGSVSSQATNLSGATLESNKVKPTEPSRTLEPNVHTWRIAEDRNSENRKAVITSTNQGPRYTPSQSESDRQTEAAEPQYRKLAKFLEDGEKKRSHTIQVMQRNNGEVVLIGVEPATIDEVQTAAGILRDGLQKVDSDAAPYLLVAGQKLIDEYHNVSGLCRVLVVVQEYQTMGVNEPPQPKVLFSQFFAPKLDGIKLNQSGIVESPHSNAHGKTETIWGEMANIPGRFRHLVMIK